MLPREDDLTPEEVAARLRRPVKTVQEWLRRGELKGYKAGHFWMVPLAQLDAFCSAPEPTRGGRPSCSRQGIAERRAASVEARRILGLR